MKNIKLLVVGILFPIFSYAAVLVDSDFEDGTMGDFVSPVANWWEISDVEPLQGTYSLKTKNTDTGVATNVYAYTNVNYDLDNYNYEWKFLMKQETDPSSANKAWFWLAADDSNFQSGSIKGYLVGVNYVGTDDKLSIWKVNGTTKTKILTSNFDVGDTVYAVKVTRTSDGLWYLYYGDSLDDMSFASSVTDTAITENLLYSGPHITYSATYYDNYRFDTLTISRNQEIPLPILKSSSETNVSTYVNEEVTFDIEATVTSFGGLFSTNKPSGSTFVEKTGDLKLSSTFSWTPDTVGSYTAIFTSTNETGTTTLPVHIEVTEIPKYNLWINEFHYDNDGGDVNEGVEIAGKAGIDLSNYTIYAYNGSNGEVYDTEELSGIIPNENNSGYGAVWFAISLLQNGAPDGLALVKDNPEEVLYFISYEGSFTGVGGPADGMISSDTGVSESGSDPVDYSLQLKGTGSYYYDFTWTAPSLYSHGKINDGQNIKAKGTVLFIK
jgi:hypothetical protein